MKLNRQWSLDPTVPVALQLVAYEPDGDDLVAEAVNEALDVVDVVHLLVGPIGDDPELAAGEYSVRPDREEEACRLFGLVHVPGNYRIGSVTLASRQDRKID